MANLTSVRFKYEHENTINIGLYKGLDWQQRKEAMPEENIEHRQSSDVIPANLEFKVLSNKMRKLRVLERLRGRSRFFGYFLEKCMYETGKLLDYFGVAGCMRLDYYNIMRCYVHMFYRLDGEKSDEMFKAIVERFRRKSGGRIQYDERVLEGIKEMVDELWKIREALNIEFKQIQYLKRLEETGKKVDWEAFEPLELEFAEPKPEGEG